MPVENLMNKIGITNSDYTKIDNNVIKFKNIKSLNIFTNNVSYLVSMSTTNIFSIITYDCTSEVLDCPTITIRDPKMNLLLVLLIRYLIKMYILISGLNITI